MDNTNISFAKQRPENMHTGHQDCLERKLVRIALLYHGRVWAGLPQGMQVTACCSRLDAKQLHCFVGTPHFMHSVAQGLAMRVALQLIRLPITSF